MTNILTIADLRRLTKEPRHVIDHALQRFGPPPSGRAGNARVWDGSQLPSILESLRRTAERSTNPARRVGPKALESR